MADEIDYVELRKLWRPRWLGSIQEFADIDTQREKWLDPQNTNPHWSFIEIMSCYFDDLGLSASDGGYRDCIATGLVTSAEAEAVSDFHAIAGAYNSPGGDVYDDAAVLDDPKWLHVVEVAKQAQVRLAKLLADPDERRWLLNP